MSDYSIMFTQFMRPNGRRVPVEMPCSEDVFLKSEFLRDKNLRFEIEVLMTGEVSATITHDEFGDVDITVAHNGPGLHERIAAMVMRFDPENMVEEDA